MLSISLKTAAVAALCTAFALPAAAADHTVEIINKTGYAITGFYGSNNDTENSEEDILGADALPHNGSLTIDFGDGTGHCIFDFLAKFENGDILRQEDVDVCAIDEFTFE